MFNKHITFKCAQSLFEYFSTHTYGRWQGIWPETTHQHKMRLRSLALLLCSPTWRLLRTHVAPATHPSWHGQRAVSKPSSKSPNQCFGSFVFVVGFCYNNPNGISKLFHLLRGCGRPNWHRDAENLVPRRRPLPQRREAHSGSAVWNTLSQRYGVVVDHLNQFEIPIQNKSSRPMKSPCLMRNIWCNM